MVLSDPAKSGVEVHGAWIDGYDSQNKDKSISITKNKCLLFFSVQRFHSKNHAIPHPLIAATLYIILNILQRRKTTMTCQ